jgi:serine/threonine protein kinase
MLAGVISAVIRMHTLGLAHNDIKPECPSQHKDGAVRYVLCDYGLTSRHDKMDYARGTEGYRFLYSRTRLLACHSGYWALGILSAEVLCASPFIAPWDLPTLGQAASDQVTIDDFVLCKFRAHGVAQAAPMLRHVLVRDPSSKVSGLDPRLARQELGNLAAYVARLEVDEQFSIQGPLRIGRRKRSHGEIALHGQAPFVQAPASLAAATAPSPSPSPAVVMRPKLESVPAHLIVRTKSQKGHMRRNARKVRWLARQKELKACATGTCDHPIHAIGDSALAPNVSSNSESQPASNSVATR